MCLSSGGRTASPRAKSQECNRSSAVLRLRRRGLVVVKDRTMRQLGTVAKVRLRGMLWMTLGRWLDHLSGSTWWALRALPQGCLVAPMKMNKFTLLDDAVWVSGVPQRAVRSA